MSEAQEPFTGARASLSHRLTDPRMARLTPAAVTKALEGFRLSCPDGMDWLAQAIQGALSCTIRDERDGHNRQSDADTRDELSRLARRASDLWLRLSERSEAANDAIFQSAYFDVGGTEEMGPLLYQAFQDAVGQLDWLSRFLGEAAASRRQPPKNWKRTIQMEERVRRAQCLSPVFESAFGAFPVMNKGIDPASQPWPVFYQRIMGLAFDEPAPPNLGEVLTEARRRDKARRVVFPPGAIPDKP